MKRVLHYTLIAIALSGNIYAVHARPIVIDDFSRIIDVGAPVLSPDGNQIAYTAGEQVFVVPVSGGTSRSVSSAISSAHHPAWSADGQWLYFLSDRSGSSQLWKLPMDIAGEAVQVTALDFALDDINFSPDQSRLLIERSLPHEGADEEGVSKPWVIDRLQFKEDADDGYITADLPAHLYVYDIATKSLTQITTGAFEESEAAWSPDGKAVVFVSNRDENPDADYSSDIWWTPSDALSDSPTRLTDNDDTKQVPAWSPDGETIAYITAVDGVYGIQQIAVVPAEGGEPQVLTGTLDRWVSDFRFSSDGRWIWFLYDDAGAVHLARVNLASRKIEAVVSGDQAITAFDIDGKGNIAATIMSNDDAGDIYFIKGRKKTRLTSTNETFLASLDLVEKRKVTFESPDGTTIDAFITRPAGTTGALPAVLDIHGGPVSQFTYGFDFGAQFLAANGYVVIQPNPRGSTGSGQSFINAIHGAWGVVDYDDVIAAVDHAVTIVYADPERLAFTVYSYGGYMTYVVNTNTDRFKGAASGAGHSHIVANYGHDIYQKWYHWELGEPWENPQGYERMSPLLRADKVTTPTIFLGGREDWNVPVLSAELFYQMLRRRGIPSRLVVYPDSHHGGWREEFSKDYLQRMVEWFDEYVKGKQRATSGTQ
ncbi:MAG: S9 family peptidase [Woeseiaceae bacterium]